jgi:hypothetical protein
VILNREKTLHVFNLIVVSAKNSPQQFSANYLKVTKSRNQHLLRQNATKSKKNCLSDKTLTNSGIKRGVVYFLTVVD